MSQSLSEEEKALAAGYVLGDLNADEVHQFEQLLQQRPDLLEEVKAMQVSFRLMPHALPKLTPPPQLLDQILRAHLAKTTVSTEPGWKRSPSFPWSKLVAAAAIFVVLLLGIDNFRLRQKLSLAQRTDIERVGAILQRPNSRLVALKGEGDLTAAGTLLFTPGQWQEVIISLGNLPPLPPNQIYRMWLTLKNGETLFCGEFNTDTEGAVFIRLNPPKTPPKGVKATGIFVTVDSTSAPLETRGRQVMTGRI
ncbi:anti-sigma factor [Leptothermofonsia sp. ETS-13]|uniref:anti-sigma factor n=1 Tax=Leptothermofonsia sp. ETS-13 TaxID=3035696 RepID=UPI003B9FC40F